MWEDDPFEGYTCVEATSPPPSPRDSRHGRGGDGGSAGNGRGRDGGRGRGRGDGRRGRGGAIDHQGAGKCYAYQKGNCDRGANCRYSHDDSGGGGGGGGGSKGPCYAYQKGNCDRGANCRFSHDGSGGGGGGGGGSKGPCYAYQKGNCDRGANCRFSHDDDGGGGGAGGGGGSGSGDGGSGNYSTNDGSHEVLQEAGYTDREIEFMHTLTSKSESNQEHGPRKSERLCSQFLQERDCRYGDECRYSHSDERAYAFPEAAEEVAVSSFSSSSSSSSSSFSEPVADLNSSTFGDLNQSGSSLADAGNSFIQSANAKRNWKNATKKISTSGAFRLNRFGLKNKFVDKMEMDDGKSLGDDDDDDDDDDVFVQDAESEDDELQNQELRKKDLQREKAEQALKCLLEISLDDQLDDPSPTVVSSATIEADILVYHLDAIASYPLAGKKKQLVRIVELLKKNYFEQQNKSKQQIVIGEWTDEIDRALARMVSAFNTSMMSSKFKVEQEQEQEQEKSESSTTTAIKGLMEGHATTPADGFFGGGIATAAGIKLEAQMIQSKQDMDSLSGTLQLMNLEEDVSELRSRLGNISMETLRESLKDKTLFSKQVTSSDLDYQSFLTLTSSLARNADAGCLMNSHIFIKQMFDRLDSDGDGKISYLELKLIFAGLCQASSLESKLRFMFDLLDQDQSNYLEEAEVIMFVKSYYTDTASMLDLITDQCSNLMLRSESETVISNAASGHLLYSAADSTFAGGGGGGGGGSSSSSSSSSSSGGSSSSLPKQHKRDRQDSVEEAASFRSSKKQRLGMDGSSMSKTMLSQKKLAKDLFSCMDVNSDGRVSFDEFAAFVSGNQEQMMLLTQKNGLMLSSTGAFHDLLKFAKCFNK